MANTANVMNNNFRKHMEALIQATQIRD